MPSSWPWVRREDYLQLVDRAKDVIVSGDENVYCTEVEVEDALYTQPHVLEATVLGVPDDQWGESVPAVVVLRDGAAGGVAGPLPHVNRGVQVPNVVQLRAEPLARSGPGKVLRRVPREPYWIDRDRSID